MSTTLKDNIKKILTWSERYTKTDMFYISKQGSWLVINQIIMLSLSFITAWAFANLLSPSTLGTYKYTLSLGGILVIFTLTGINTSVIRSISRGYETSIFLALRKKIQWGLLGTGAGLFMAFYYYINHNMTLAGGMLLIALTLPFIYSFNIYGPLLQGQKKFKKYSLFSSLHKILFSLSLIITVILTQRIMIILAVYVISYMLLNILFFLLSTQKLSKQKKPDLQAISYGKHLSIMDVFSTIASNTDKILLFHFLGATDLALYSMAILPVTYIKDAIRLLGSLALPKLSEKHDTSTFKLGHKVMIMSIFIIPIIGLYILISPYIFRIFFPRYIDAIVYSQFFSIMLLATPKLLIDTALTAFKKTKALYISKIVSPISTVICMVMCIPWWGITGAIIAFLMGQIINYIILFIVYRKSQSGILVNR